MSFVSGLSQYEDKLPQCSAVSSHFVGPAGADVAPGAEPSPSQTPQVIGHILMNLNLSS